MLAGGRIDKIQQPERDEVHLLIRSGGSNRRLLISSNAAAPRIHLTGGPKENPEKAPMFCMLLRKYIGGGKILGVSADGFERVVQIAVESANELGDISVKTLIAEIMGKHSNLILVNENGRIIDSLVHVDRDMSSVREIMPARQYVPPPPQDKLTPGAVPAGEIFEEIKNGYGSARPLKISEALLGAVMGASPYFCGEVCRKAGIDPLTPPSEIGADGYVALRDAFSYYMDNVGAGKYSPCVLLREPPPEGYGGRMAPDLGNGGNYLDFYCWKAYSAGAGLLTFDTMNAAADEFYNGRSRAASLAQRKAGLVKLVTTNIGRCKKKLAIQQESLRESANRDVLRLYGEPITANIHNIAQGSKSAN
jgi:predicted ribosome quality control (RQC) complex YloA/Tae2 family protein